MYSIFLLFFKAWNRVWNFLSNWICVFRLRAEGVYVEEGFKSSGVPVISNQGTFRFGRNFRINNRILSNPIGRQNKCMFIVREKGELIIGDNVGISGSAIVCQKRIEIGNHVKIGGNVCIYDTDFHSLDPKMRANVEKDFNFTNRQSVLIGNNVFIGAHTTILKGVSIGHNSIIGACSVVSKNVPTNEIWAGNPAKFIRKLK